jgi:hypothetical protein
MKQLLLIITLLLSMGDAIAQGGYAAFTDLYNRFYIVDDGTKSELEGLPPQNYAIGRTGIAYIDNIGMFKVYRNGYNNVINRNFTASYQVTDYLITYKTQNSLHVIDDHEEQELTRWAGDYGVGDSIILYYDRVKNILNSFYNGKKYELETNLATEQFSDFKVSDNVIAYQNFMNQFKVFIYGESHVLESQPVLEYKVGRNIVAYLDYNKQFKVYYNGTTTTLDAFPPKSFKVGDGFVAFVGYDGYFKIFYNNQTESIGYFEKNYLVSDFTCAYEDGTGFFKLFHQGKHYEVDNFWPSSLLQNYHSMAYINRGNTLRLFSNGNMYDVTTMVNKLDNAKLNYDVLQYQLGANMFRTFVNGKDN